MKIQNNKINLGIKMLVIAGITIASIVGTYAFNEIILQPANAQNAITLGSNTSSQVVGIQWPPVGSDHSPAPIQHIKVVIGVNNTVQWINKGERGTWISANNMSDPDFANAAPVFVSSSNLPHEYKIQRTVTVGPEKTEVFYTGPDTAGKVQSFITMPMKSANNVIVPGKSFEYTFTHVGTFGYHGKPWERGYVTVLDGSKTQ